MNTCKNCALRALFAVAALTIFVTAPPADAQAKAQQKPPAAPSPQDGATTWPAAPQSSPELLENLTPEYKSYHPSLKFEGPLPEPPPNPYNLLSEATNSNTLRGTLLYPTDYDRQFLVLRGIGVSGLINGQPTNVATYPLEAFSRIFEPQFSADGKRILFKVGWPFESTGEYFLFLWDTTTAKVRAVSREPNERSGPSIKDRRGEGMVFRNVYWSPNSRWIAYVRGGDRGGKVWKGMQYPQLRVLDVDSGHSRRVVRNFGVVRDMAWTSQNTLLFVMLPQDKMPPQQEKERDKATDPEPEAPPQMSVFETTPGRGTPPRLLIANAERPLPSPDNRWIAFVRPQADRNDPKQELCVFNRQSGAIKTLATKKISDMQWTPDSRRLVLLTAFYYGEEGGGARGEGQLSVLDVQGGEQRDVAKLEAHDYKPMSGSEDKAQFKVLKLSRDGRFLLVYVTEVGVLGAPAEGRHARNQLSLQAVNLSNGGVTTVARFDSPGPSIMGLDWHDETGTSSTVSTNTRANTGSSSGKRNGGR